MLLKEWIRVIKPGGFLLVAVPDLKVLSRQNISLIRLRSHNVLLMFRMYLDESISVTDRWMITRMIYGGQSDPFDYHKVGFDEQILSSILFQV